MNVFVQIYIYFLAFLFGAIIGSFLNVVIYRLPRGSFMGEKRSYCPHCKMQIKSYDLIPIASFFILKGRCRNCKEKISPRYPSVELFCGLMAVCVLIRFGFRIEAPLIFGVIAILTAITMIDYDTKEIPNILVICLVPYAIAAAFVYEQVGIVERLIGLFVISLPMLILALIINGAFGGGDIKLMAVCGFMLGVKNTLFAFFVALVLGGGYAIYLLLTKKAKKGTQIAFGPYLCTGLATAIFFGAYVTAWYMKFYQ